MIHLNRTRFIVTTAVLCSFVLPLYAGASALMPAQEQNESGIAYITGGIAEEAEIMRGIAKNYTLEMAFVQKLKQQEEFISEVAVKIINAKKDVVLDAVTKGPYLYANVPSGRYTVVAEFNGVEKRQHIVVNAKKHQKIVFWWPITEPPQQEDSAVPIE